MGVDVFPQVYVEKRVARAWVPWSPKTGKPLKRAAHLRVDQTLAARSYEALMDACIAACPDGAAFSSVHERTFESFAKKALAAEPSLEQDYLFGAGALSTKKLRAIADGAPPASLAEEDAASVWAEAAGELRRWADVVSAAGADRVCYWFDIQ